MTNSILITPRRYEERREKVIAAFQGVVDDEAVYDALCANDLEYLIGEMKAAIELLEAQESHVLTFNRVLYLARNPGECAAWVEEKDFPATSFPVLIQGSPFIDGAGFFKIIDSFGIKSFYPHAKYGIDYRMWSSHPHESQMKAVEWND